MEQQLNGLGKTIMAADPARIRLDQTVKNVLAYKPLLARIFKEVVEECRDMSPDEIEACIEGEVLVSRVFLEGGLTNAGERMEGLFRAKMQAKDAAQSGERIEGLNVESYLDGEGLNLYDLRTYLRLPRGRGQYIKLLINLEAQNDDKPGYDVSLRALFYCCRMISAQHGVEFTTNTDDPVKYGNIKKVYSIWICTETAQKRANSIEKYAVKREFLAGSNTDEPRYDIMNAILINISGKHDVENTDNELIRLLTDLFDERMNGAEKVAKLKEKYGLRVTREVEREVSEMCTYASAIEKKGIENGLKALVRSLKEFISEFDPLYQAVIRNEEYANVSRDKVREYFDELDGE